LKPANAVPDIRKSAWRGSSSVATSCHSASKLKRDVSMTACSAMIWLASYIALPLPSSARLEQQVARRDLRLNARRRPAAATDADFAAHRIAGRAISHASVTCAGGA
jgi:hypothetical protein